MENYSDSKGRTEEEFLAEYDRTKYDRPAYTADNLLLADCGDGLAVLLIRRGNHPHMGQWALPGGFVNPNEKVADAAKRELTEETGINVETEQLITVSAPKRDPRGWTVSTCFMGLLSEPIVPNAGDDASEAKWFKIDYLAAGDVYKLKLTCDGIDLSAEMNVSRDAGGKIDIDSSEILVNNGIAFDHAKIILYAVESL